MLKPGATDGSTIAGSTAVVARHRRAMRLAVLGAPVESGIIKLEVGTATIAKTQGKLTARASRAVAVHATRNGENGMRKARTVTHGGKLTKAGKSKMFGPGEHLQPILSK
jgi:hypothetical protein